MLQDKACFWRGCSLPGTHGCDGEGSGRWIKHDDGASSQHEMRLIECTVRRILGDSLAGQIATSAGGA